MPTEADGVIAVTSAARAGARPTTPTTASSRPTSRPRAATPRLLRHAADVTPNLILAPYPEALARASGDDRPRTAARRTTVLVRDCQGTPARTTSTCRARRWRRRTPWASRRSRGRVRQARPRHGGLTLDPRASSGSSSARRPTRRARREPVRLSGPRRGRTRRHARARALNGFFGDGLVSAPRISRPAMTNAKARPRSARASPTTRRASSARPSVGQPAAARPHGGSPHSVASSGPRARAVARPAATCSAG